MPLIRRLVPALLLLCLPLFFVGGPGFYSPRSSVAFWDLGHVGYFGLLTLWLAAWSPVQRPGLSGLARLALLTLLPFLAGLAVEVLQFFVRGRSAGLGDLGRDLVGIVLALAFFPWPQAERWKQVLRALRVLALALLLLAVWPFLRAMLDEDRARRDFPVLADFETKDELSRWYHANQFRLDDQIVRHGRHSARIQLSTARISGVTLLHFPSDWRGFQWLLFSVYNPLTRPLELHCRLNDAQHRRTRSPYSDRFNTRFMLQPGWNDLRISLDEAAAAPKGRRMNMAQIAGFALFVVQQEKAMALRLDNVRLEESGERSEE